MYAGCITSEQVSDCTGHVSIPAERPVASCGSTFVRLQYDATTQRYAALRNAYTWPSVNCDPGLTLTAHARRWLMICPDEQPVVKRMRLRITWLNKLVCMVPEVEHLVAG